MSGPDLLAALAKLPLIVILRGVLPQAVQALGARLGDEGVRCLEVPFTSPHAARCIQLLASDPRLLVGGGTVTTLDQVDACREAGATYALAPNVDQRVIRHACVRGLQFVPGFFTASEAFAALAAGARLLKFFPAGEVSPSYLNAMRALLPADIPIIATGSLTPQQVSAYLAAGVTAVALGSAVYQPEDDGATVIRKLEPFLDAVRR